MLRTRLSFTSIAAVSALAILCGCGDKTQKQAEDIDIAQQLNQEAINLYQGGNTNEAIQLLEEALADKAIDEEPKERLFSNLINLYLTCGKPETAELKTLAKLSDSASSFENAAGSIIRYYEYNKSTDEQLLWCSKLIDLEISDQFKSYALYQLLSIYQSKQQLDVALDLISKRTQQFSPSIRNNIIRSLAYQTMRSGDFEGAEKVLSTGENLFPEDADLKKISTVASIDILFNSKQWDKGIESIKSAAGNLDDQTLRSVLMRSTKLLNNGGQHEKTSMLCKTILTDHKNLANTCRQAALTYIKNAEDKPSEEAARLTSLESMDIDPGILFSCYRKCFYNILGSNKPEILAQLKEVADKLAPALTSDNDAVQMKTLSLELAFMMEDYKQAIKLVKSGIEGKDEAWSKLAIAKMQAHQALKDDKPEEAIGHFREFMKMIAEETEPQSDPTTGILHSKEMLLGRNAKRIGDIYLSINKKEEAKKCYSEAEQYYIEAKANMDKKNTKSLELIDQEKAEVMQAKTELSAS